MAYCPHCGEKVVGRRELCAYCGGDLKNDMITSDFVDDDGDLQLVDFARDNYDTEGKLVCPQCGSMCHQTLNYCPKCGTYLNTGNVQIVPKDAKIISKKNDLLWCAGLGWLGGHKFYEGKPVMGTIYALTFGLFGIGTFVDFISIAANQDKFYPKKYKQKR